MTAAEYQRRYRQRQRDGIRVVAVEIDAAVVEDALIRRRFLRRKDADNPAAIAAALREAVRQLIVPPDASVNLNGCDSLDVVEPST